MKKKVLFICLSLYNGGAERSLVNLLNELPKDKYELDLMLFKKEGLYLSEVPNYVNIVDPPIALKKLYSPLFKAGFYGLIKLFGTVFSRIFAKKENDTAYRWVHFYSKFVSKYEKQYDVAISYISGEACYFLVDKINAKRKITWVHNHFQNARHSEKYDRIYFEKLDKIVTISEECLASLEDVFPSYKSKICFIPNITSSKTIINKSNEYIPNDFDYNYPIILSIGRFSPQKGYDLAIDAANIMKQKGIIFKWYFIGDGELKQNLLKKIKNYELEDYIKLLGVRKNPYVYIKNSTIVAQTSRFEGKSIVLDETKILSKPILVTNYDTAKDQINNGVEGHIVDLNPSSIANGLELLLKNFDYREHLIRNLSSKDYGNSFVISKYIELIDKE